MVGYIDRQLEENYENADIILTLLFAFIDFGIIIFSLFNLKSKSEKMYTLKSKLFFLYIIDIFLRILYTKRYHKSNLFINEIVLSFLKTFQFFLILSFLEQTFNDTKINKKGKFYKYLSKKQLCIIFSLITFSYEKFSTSSKKEICLIQSLLTIYCIYVLYYRLKNKIVKIVENIVKKGAKQNRNLFQCIVGFPLPCFILFITYYILKICFLFPQNANNIIYSNIIFKIIIDSSKYFLFFILEIILYIINGIKIQDE